MVLGSERWEFEGGEGREGEERGGDRSIPPCLLFLNTALVILP